MKERPITFSALMVREILDGHKTQTRRVKTPGKCRYGEPGDQLWVRENAWYDPEGRRVDYDADMLTATRAEVKAGGAKLKSSRYMPREASRIDLLIQDLRLERLQDMTEEDAIAEGMCANPSITALQNFEYLWNEINGKRGYWWESNPLVWVIEFEMVEGI